MTLTSKESKTHSFRKERLRGPDFLGIGMERAGTSWIYRMLAAHPSAWVPPIKELHYFDFISPEMKTRPRRYSTHLRSRVRQKAATFWRFEKRPEFYKNTALEYLLWDARFFSGAFDDAWYQSLFDQRFVKGRICGEITPAYSNLSKDMVSRIHKMNPGMKFILTLRDPAERAWSGMIRQLCGVRNRPFNSLTEEEMLAYLKDNYVHANSNIPKFLEVWKGEVPNERLFIRPTTAMRDQPLTFLNELYDFLDIDASFVPPAHLLQNEVNSHTKKYYEKPEAVNAYLDEAFGDLGQHIRSFTK